MYFVVNVAVELQNSGRMIKAIMLIVEPTLAWDSVAMGRRRISQVCLVFLLPLLLLSLAGELAGMVYLGRHNPIEGTIKLPMMQIVEYGVSELALSFALVFIGGKLVQSLAQTFHTRNTYEESFTVVAYGLSPLFLVRLLNAFPFINPWVSFGIGMVLCVATLYYGLPRILEPDPPHAFGLYMMSAFLLSGVAALVRCITWLLLTGKIRLH